MTQRAGLPIRAGDVVSIEMQIRCVQRELDLRRKVYPGRVHLKKMRAEDAAQETWHMQAVLDTLRAAAGQPTATQPDLLGTTKPQQLYRRG